MTTTPPTLDRLFNNPASESGVWLSTDRRTSVRVTPPRAATGSMYAYRVEHDGWSNPRETLASVDVYRWLADLGALPDP